MKREVNATWEREGGERRGREREQERECDSDVLNDK